MIRALLEAQVLAEVTKGIKIKGHQEQ